MALRIYIFGMGTNFFHVDRRTSRSNVGCKYPAMADAARECWTRALKVSQPSLDPYQCPVYSPKPDRAGSQKFHSQHHLHSLKGTDFSDLSVWPSLSESEISAFAKIPQSTSIANTGWRRFAAKGCNFLKTVHRFAPAFDVFVQQQPFLATLVWGTARFLLQVSGDKVQSTKDW